MVADAILDRVLHRAVVLNIRDPSRRMKEHQALAEAFGALTTTALALKEVAAVASDTRRVTMAVTGLWRLFDPPASATNVLNDTHADPGTTLFRAVAALDDKRSLWVMLEGAERGVDVVQRAMSQHIGRGQAKDRSPRILTDRGRGPDLKL